MALRRTLISVSVLFQSTRTSIPHANTRPRRKTREERAIFSLIFARHAAKRVGGTLWCLAPRVEMMAETSLSFTLPQSRITKSTPVRPRRAARQNPGVCLPVVSTKCDPRSHERRIDGRRQETRDAEEGY